MFLIASCIKQLEPKPRAALLATYDAQILLATFSLDLRFRQVFPLLIVLVTVT
jgi:hypothetical protein